MTPKDAKRKQKEPWTLEYLTKICNGLNSDDPKDIAIRACLTTAFWGTARLGEVTIPNLKAFDAEIHVKPSDLRFGVMDRDNNEQTVITLPWSKVSKEKGEEIYWAHQEGAADPKAALKHHLWINNPPKDAHLFSFKYNGSFRPMSRHIFLDRIDKVAAKLKLEKLTGHGIRVGSTLEYLLRGLSFKVIKTKGRWRSDAFQGYLRKHAQITAQYMQSRPSAYDSLVRRAIPPIS